MKNLTSTQQEQNLIEEIKSANDNYQDWKRSYRKNFDNHSRKLMYKYADKKEQAKQALKAYRKANK